MTIISNERAYWRAFTQHTGCCDDQALDAHLGQLRYRYDEGLHYQHYREQYDAAYGEGLADGYDRGWQLRKVQWLLTAPLHVLQAINHLLAASMYAMSAQHDAAYAALYSSRRCIEKVAGTLICIFNDCLGKYRLERADVHEKLYALALLPAGQRAPVTWQSPHTAASPASPAAAPDSPAAASSVAATRLCDVSFDALYDGDKLSQKQSVEALLQQLPSVTAPLAAYDGDLLEISVGQAHALSAAWVNRHVDQLPNAFFCFLGDEALRGLDINRLSRPQFNYLMWWGQRGSDLLDFSGLSATQAEALFGVSQGRKSWSQDFFHSLNVAQQQQVAAVLDQDTLAQLTDGASLP